MKFWIIFSILNIVCAIVFGAKGDVSNAIHTLIISAICLAFARVNELKEKGE